MAQKTIKKTTSKKTAVKPAVKRTVKAPVVDAPMAPECHCGGHCCCCCHGRRFLGFCVKLIILVMVFLLGCISSPWVLGKLDKSMMKHIKYDDNGCVVMDSVKCPKMLEKLTAADENMDGCITKAELRNVFKDMHRAPMGPGHHMPHRFERPVPQESMDIR